MSEQSEMSGNRIALCVQFDDDDLDGDDIDDDNS